MPGLLLGGRQLRRPRRPGHQIPLRTGCSPLLAPAAATSTALCPLPPPGDFPDVDRYREILSAFDLSRFPKLDKSMIRQVGLRVIWVAAGGCAG